MLRKLHLQRVQDSSGFIVQSAGRYTIEYLEDGRMAKITVDPGMPTTGVYRDTLTAWILTDGTTQPMTDADRLRVSDNIGRGLAFMGVEIEWCDGPSP